MHLVYRELCCSDYSFEAGVGRLCRFRVGVSFRVEAGSGAKGSSTGSGERPNRPFRKLLDTLEPPGSSEGEEVTTGSGKHP